MSTALLSLRAPAPDAFHAIVAAQREAPLTYDLVGQTLGDLPDGWSNEERAVQLGRGASLFQRARAELERWTPFDLDWTHPLATDVPIRDGELFGFVARTFGLFSVNVCRIVWVVDEPDRFGFAFGTVGTHALEGEESFVLWRDEDDAVYFQIRKFSRPGNTFYRLVGPVTRWVQRRFTREALARMQRAVASS